MRIKTLVLTAVMAGLFNAAAKAEQFTPIELKVDDSEIGLIEVTGDHLDAYRNVITKTLGYSVWVRGDTPASEGDSIPDFILSAIEDSKWANKYQGPLYEDWNKYKIALPYADVKLGLSTARLAPVKRCNKALNETSGAARQEFLIKGATLSVPSAFPIRAGIIDGTARVVTAPVTIKCLPLDHNPIQATFRIEPAKVEQVGKFLCPMELKLHGAAESREAFRGKAIFVGPHYLSAITELNYTKAGNRNVTATYKISWSQMGGFTSGAPKEPKKQDLTFHFNVADQNNKVVRSVEERVEVSCRKIKSNAPTASGGMTVAPTN